MTNSEQLKQEETMYATFLSNEYWKLRVNDEVDSIFTIEKFIISNLNWFLNQNRYSAETKIKIIQTLTQATKIEGEKI